MKLGLYHDISSLEEAEPEAARIAGLGFQGVQFSASRKVAPGRPRQWIDLDDDACRRIRRVHEQHGLEIVALSGYTNLTPRREDERLRNVEQLRALIRRAPEFGARCVVTWSGWRGDRLLDADPSIDTAPVWETFMASADAVVATAQEVGITIAWELYFTHVLNSPARVLAALERWGSRNVGIVMDGPNLVPLDRLDHLEAMVDEQFAALGKYIALMHAKDICTEDGEIAYPEPGGGLLDYRRYMDRLRDVGYDGYVIVEHVTEQNVAAARDYVRRFI
jgi:sugar phosphate isomerase/epimerase